MKNPRMRMISLCMAILLILCGCNKNADNTATSVREPDDLFIYETEDATGADAAEAAGSAEATEANAPDTAAEAANANAPDAAAVTDTSAPGATKNPSASGDTSDSSATGATTDASATGATTDASASGAITDVPWGSESPDESQGSGASGVPHGGVFELISKIKDKYAEASPYIYTEPMYNLPPDYEFVFEDASCYRDAGNSPYKDFAVYLDAGLKPGTEMFIHTDWDWDPDVVTVGPDWEGAFSASDNFNYDYDKREWGNAPKYWLVQYRDVKTGDLYEKPIVTLFTIKRELSAPILDMKIDGKGYANLEWDAVSGADRYTVYESYLNESDHGFGWVSLNKIGETTDTFFNDFEDRNYASDDYGYHDVYIMNSMFSHSSRADAPRRLFFSVIATNADYSSGASNFIYADNYFNRLPNVNELKYVTSGGDEIKGYSYNSVAEMPSHVLIKMCDQSLKPMLLDYESAYKAPIQEDIDLWLNLIVPVLSTDFTCELCLMPDDLEPKPEDLYKKGRPFLIERQKQLTAVASDVAPKNRISNAPGAGTTQVKVDPDTVAENVRAMIEAQRRINEFDAEIYANNALSEYLAMNMLQGVERICVSDFSDALDAEYLYNSFCEAYRQNPLISPIEELSFDYSSDELVLVYDMDADEMKAMQEAVAAEVRKVVSEIIAPGMGSLEKEIAINQYICDTAEYDFDALKNAEKNDYESIDKEFIYSFTPYGVLINKTGVCASYAGAFKLLGDAAGLDVVVVTGYMDGNMPHAWNRVNLDGQWMTVDPTNNDSLLANSLFNVPDRVANTVLTEDAYYLYLPVLSEMEGAEEDLEWYRQTDGYYSPDDLAPVIGEALRAGNDILLRTDYDMSQEDVMKIILEAIEDAGIKPADFLKTIKGVYSWLGVVYIEMV